MRDTPKRYNTLVDFSNCASMQGNYRSNAISTVLSLLNNSDELSRLGASKRDLAGSIGEEFMRAQIITEGDSRSAFQFYQPEMLALLGVLYSSSNYDSYTNTSVGGSSMQTNILGRGSTVDGYFDSKYAYNIAVLWVGTNDFYYGQTASQVLTDMQTWCEARQASGFKTVVLTEIPWDRGAGSSAFISDLNDGILAAPAWIDAIADCGNDATLIANWPAWNADGVHFSDGVHPTQLTLETYIAPYVADAIETIIS